VDAIFHPELMLTNLTSPAVICSVIGAFAALIKSDLRVPPQVHETISMYLLFAIGLKGGIALSQISIPQIRGPDCSDPIFGTIPHPILAYA